MYQNACGAAAASAGGCVETDRECHSLISKDSQIPAIEHDYSGFDIIKATQVNNKNFYKVYFYMFVFLVWSFFKS